MLNEGAWSNAKNLLSEKNLDVVIAAIELLSNLAICESILSLTKMILELDIILA